MSLRIAAVLGIALLINSCADSSQKVGHPAPVPQRVTETAKGEVKSYQLALFDEARNRAVPITVYVPGSGAKLNPAKRSNLKLAILNHGYGSPHTGYSFIAYNLVAQGYFVASIQHDLPKEARMPTTGNPQQVRRPFWERGAQNMLFVLQALKKSNPELDFKNLLLVGHSNGGDMAMLFAHKYPKLARNIISLDNRRMPLPRTRRPHILTIRSSDQVADDGVLPTAAEQKKYAIQIVKMENMTHNDIWDGATEEKKQEINRTINNFLKTK
ncbi:alpha/beta hydrolase [Hymenobacter sp. BT188]|uniref:alpha/beta hydrolase n=1 Tax=Hymenobacter sp. BT188 TaxID=2763504 RepID=UPI0016514620|nr:alpha/beta hydrolase [Hymenobacter sp. BT188]MBC6607517.1 alpha/beta hydrolase [Hymenobacter sp. BT188]